MIELSDSNFDEAIGLSKKCIVYFWAEWCGPCKRVSPIIEEIQSEYGIDVFKVDSDKNPQKVSEFSVFSIPTMVLFEDGTAIKTVTGAMPKHLIIKEFIKWL
jgi:thioredoxin 1